MSTAAPTLASALYDPWAPYVESLQQREIRLRAGFEAGALATGCAHEVTQVPPVPAAVYRVAITGLGRWSASPEDARDRQAGSTGMGHLTQALPAINPTIAIDWGDAVNHQPGFATAGATPSADRAVCAGLPALVATAGGAA